MNELNTSQSDAGGGFGLEAEHASYPSFDPAMILLDGVVHVFTGTDGDGLSTLSQRFSASHCIIAVRLA